MYGPAVRRKRIRHPGCRYTQADMITTEQMLAARALLAVD
jgi:hypothetical protein